MRLSQRGDVVPFHVMEVAKAAARRAQTHGDVIGLHIGQPGTGAPQVVREAVASAVREQDLGYTEAAGILALREAIAEHYRAQYGVQVHPDEVVLTTGSSGGFTAIFLAAFDPGDAVVVTRPGYPAYRNTLEALGCRVLDLDCGPENRYQPTVAQLDALPEKPAGLVLASPANPTGTIVPADELAAIARWCEANDCLLISDEIYHGITYGEPGRCAWETSREAVVVGSFSKYFSMTGWRLGWALLPAHLQRPVELLLGNLNLCPPAVSQAAALAALTPAADAELRAHVERYAANRQVVLDALPGIGVHDQVAPDGAFYAWVDLSHLTTDTMTWCARLLDETGVALTPGVDFAPARPGGDPRLDGNRFVRLSFAGRTDDVIEGLQRVGRFVG